MASAAVKLPPDADDPVLQAIARARTRIGPPLTEEERLAIEEGRGTPWVCADEMTAEIARRCAGK